METACRKSDDESILPPGLVRTIGAILAAGSAGMIALAVRQGFPPGLFWAIPLAIGCAMIIDPSPPTPEAVPDILNVAGGCNG